MDIDSMFLSEGATKIASLAVVVLLIGLLIIRWKGEQNKFN